MRWHVARPPVSSLVMGWLLLGLSPAVTCAEPAPEPPPLQSAPGTGGNESLKPADRLDDPHGILNLDIDQLAQVDVVAPALNLEVSTVERQESTVGRTPSAVFVVTNEIIRRSGARTIPDVLRLVPGVHVYQENANEWAVSIRGFSSVYSDKLLVQIDGRSVYTSLFGGVFWDVQDLVFDDIERIEVIRGPGATVWGANAVNGVINIITKGSKETQGGYFEGGAGTEQRGFTTARYGGQLSDNATYRVYGKWFDRDNGWADNRDAADDWNQARTGFRIDWTPQPSDALTLQGDSYDGHSGNEGLIAAPSPPFTQAFVQDTHVSGGNVLGRWTHVLDTDSDWSIQWYYDRAERHDQVLNQVLDYEVMDLDFQYRFPLAAHHELICGFGYRNYSDFLRTAYNLGFDPNERADDLFSYFVQDRIELREDLLYLILGSKFEHNDYTGFEIQPTARILWTPDKKRCIWGAISRAVQTPTRLTANGMVRERPHWIVLPPPYPPVTVPLFEEVHGSPALGSAEVIAYELGMRAQPTKAFNWDLAIFFNQYHHLPGITPLEPFVDVTPTGWWAAFAPAELVSNIPGETYGVELAAGYELNQQWNLRGAYTFLREQFHDRPEVASYSLFAEGTSARNLFYLWLSGDLGRHWFLDLIGRNVDELEDPEVPSYFVGDARLAYRPRPTLEWSLVGRNLLEGVHSEADGRYTTGVEQEVYGAVTCRF